MNMNQKTVQAKPATLRDVLSAINGRTRGAYSLRAKKNDWNEVVISLRGCIDGRMVTLAEGFIDCGHTAESRQDAYAEALALANAYMAEAQAVEVTA